MATSSLLATFYLVCGFTIIFLAVLILRFSTRDISTWSNALVMIFAGIGPILGAIGVYIEQNLKEGTYLFENLVESFDYTWEFFFPSLLLVALVYPKRYDIWKYVRRFAFILFLPHVFHLLMVLLLVDRVNPSRMFNFLTDLPFSSAGFATLANDTARSLNVFSELLFKAHKQLFSLVNLMYAVVALGLLGYNLRRDPTPRQSRQIHIVLAGLGMAIMTYSAARIVPWFMRADLDDHVATALINASLIIGGGSIAYVIIKYQLLDVRMIARKGIFYGVTTVIFAGFILAVIKPFTDFISRFTGTDLDFIETLLVILLIVVFQPALVRLEEWTESTLIREESPRVKIRNLSNELLSAIDEEQMRESIRSVLSGVFGTSRIEMITAKDIESKKEEDIYAGRVLELMEQVGEPMSRLDFLKSLGFIRGRRGFFRPGRKVIREAIVGLPAAVRSIAEYALIVPIIRDGECVSILLLGEKKEGARYSMQQQAMLAMLSSQVVASLSRLELLEQIVEKKVMEEELNIARSIQLNLLPASAPKLDNYEASALSVSSKQVGGDYYDFIKNGRSLAFTVADVSGKGVPASLLMASLQASLRAMMDRMTDPVAVIGRLNDVMCDITSPDKFATMFYGCVDLENNRLSYSNAGHFFPVIVRDGGEIEVLDYSGLILGVTPGFPYEDRMTSFERGDMLVVTTDGVTEAENTEGELYGEERLYPFLSSLSGMEAQSVRDSIVEEVERFSEPVGVSDDLTILVIRRTA